MDLVGMTRDDPGKDPEKIRQGSEQSKRILEFLDRNLARAWQQSLTRHALPKGRAADIYPTALRAPPPPCLHCAVGRKGGGEDGGAGGW